MTKDKLMRCGLLSSNECVLCGTYAESKDLFSNCNFFKEVWKKVQYRL